MKAKKPQNYYQDEMNAKSSRPFVERRTLAHHNDKLYRTMVALNIVAWLILVLALIVFHYARPEFITGVQTYWEIDGRTEWSKQHLRYLLWLLEICLVTTIVTLLIRRKRNRRKSDRVGINILILLFISFTSLITLYINV